MTKFLENSGAVKMTSIKVPCTCNEEFEPGVNSFIDAIGQMTNFMAMSLKSLKANKRADEAIGYSVLCFIQSAIILPEWGKAVANMTGTCENCAEEFALQVAKRFPVSNIEEIPDGS